PSQRISGPRFPRARTRRKRGRRNFFLTLLFQGGTKLCRRTTQPPRLWDLAVLATYLGAMAREFRGLAPIRPPRNHRPADRPWVGVAYTQSLHHRGRRRTIRCLIHF